LAEYAYECMFILDSNKYARDPAGVSGQIPAMLEKCGGQILANRLWNEQKLAYPIKNQRKGTYWLTYVRMDSQNLVAFNRACQLNENILRHLVLKIEPRLVDTLVSHALGEPKPAKPDDKPAAPPAEEEGELVGVAEGEADVVDKDGE
jgi:small subunit ribosomal protein S6